MKMRPIQELPPSLLGNNPLAVLFDSYCMIDPSTSSVLTYQNGSLIEAGHKCFEQWNRAAACKDCISKRACRENRCRVKLEYIRDTVNLIYAVPLAFDGRQSVLILAKEVTDSMSVTDRNHRDNTSIVSLMDEFNYLLVHDTFTGLFNKQYIEAELRSRIHRSTAEQVPLCAAILDIDRFKCINDKFGHMIGDSVLKGIAGCIAELSDYETAFAGRMGGDEFLLIFWDKMLPEAERACLELSTLVLEKNFSACGRCFHVSVSIGLKEFDAEVDTPDNFMEKIDQRMYYAKRRKRQPPLPTG